jgi:hypothetical protein
MEKLVNYRRGHGHVIHAAEDLGGAGGMGAPLTPLRKLVLEGRITKSAPMPLVRCLESFNMPMKMPTMDRIMTTSMATASTLMMERTGRCNRLAKMSLFIPEMAPRGCKSLEMPSLSG